MADCTCERRCNEYPLCPTGQTDIYIQGRRAGIEAERERIKARIEKYAEMEEEIAEDYTSPDYGRGIVAGYRAALSVIDEEGSMSEKVCPDCGGHGKKFDGTDWKPGRGYAEFSCPACSESGLPPVDPAVLDRAVEAGTKAIDGFKWPSARICADEVIKAAAPVVADAAYRQGREDGVGDLVAEVEMALVPSDHWSPEYLAGFRLALDKFRKEADAARSLLTDKEEA